MRKFIEVEEGMSILTDRILEFAISNKYNNPNDKGVWIFLTSEDTYLTKLYSYNELKALLNGEDDYITK